MPKSISDPTKKGTVLSFLYLSIMEQETTTTRKSARYFPSERFRSFLVLITAVCLLTCIVFQFIFFFSMKRRLDGIETELKDKEKRLVYVESELSVVYSEESKHNQSERRLAVLENDLSAISKALKRSKSDLKRSLRRNRRTTNQQINLSDLDKRIITLESRYDKLRYIN